MLQPTAPVSDGIDTAVAPVSSTVRRTRQQAQPESSPHMITSDDSADGQELLAHQEMIALCPELQDELDFNRVIDDAEQNELDFNRRIAFPLDESVEDGSTLTKQSSRTDRLTKKVEQVVNTNIRRVEEHMDAGGFTMVASTCSCCAKVFTKFCCNCRTRYRYALRVRLHVLRALVIFVAFICPLADVILKKLDARVGMWQPIRHPLASLLCRAVWMMWIPLVSYLYFADANLPTIERSEVSCNLVVWAFLACLQCRVEDTFRSLRQEQDDSQHTTLRSRLHILSKKYGAKVWRFLEVVHTASGTKYQMDPGWLNEVKKDQLPDCIEKIENRTLLLTNLPGQFRVHMAKQSSGTKVRFKPRLKSEHPESDFRRSLSFNNTGEDLFVDLSVSSGTRRLDESVETGAKPESTAPSIDFVSFGGCGENTWALVTFTDHSQAHHGLKRGLSSQHNKDCPVKLVAEQGLPAVLQSMNLQELLPDDHARGIQEGSHGKDLVKGWTDHLSKVVENDENLTQIKTVRLQRTGSQWRTKWLSSAETRPKLVHLLGSASTGWHVKLSARLCWDFLKEYLTARAEVLRDVGQCFYLWDDVGWDAEIQMRDANLEQTGMERWESKNTFSDSIEAAKWIMEKRGDNIMDPSHDLIRKAARGQATNFHKIPRSSDREDGYNSYEFRFSAATHNARHLPRWHETWDKVMEDIEALGHHGSKQRQLMHLKRYWLDGVQFDRRHQADTQSPERRFFKEIVDSVYFRNGSAYNMLLEKLRVIGPMEYGAPVHREYHRDPVSLILLALVQLHSQDFLYEEMEAEGADIIRQYDDEDAGALYLEQLDNLLSGPDVPHSKGCTADDLMHFFDKNNDNKISESEFPELWTHLATCDPWQRSRSTDFQHCGTEILSKKCGADILHDIVTTCLIDDQQFQLIKKNTEQLKLTLDKHYGTCGGFVDMCGGKGLLIIFALLVVLFFPVQFLYSLAESEHDQHILTNSAIAVLFTLSCLLCAFGARSHKRLQAMWCRRKWEKFDPITNADVHDDGREYNLFRLLSKLEEWHEGAKTEGARETQRLPADFVAETICKLASARAKGAGFWIRLCTATVALVEGFSNVTRAVILKALGIVSEDHVSVYCANATVLYATRGPLVLQTGLRMKSRGVCVLSNTSDPLCESHCSICSCNVCSFQCIFGSWQTTSHIQTAIIFLNCCVAATVTYHLFQPVIGVCEGFYMRRKCLQYFSECTIWHGMKAKKGNQFVQQDHFCA